MVDTRIQPAFYTQLENPNQHLDFLGGADYAKEMRDKQDKLLRKLISSNNQFAAAKSKSSTSILAQQKMLEDFHAPVTSALKGVTKSIIDQLQATYGLTKTEFAELIKLLETYNKLKPKDQQRIITLFDKSNIPMEERAKVLAAAANKDPTDNNIIEQLHQVFNGLNNNKTNNDSVHDYLNDIDSRSVSTFDDSFDETPTSSRGLWKDAPLRASSPMNDYASVVANKGNSDAWEWDSSDLSRPLESLNANSKIEFTPITPEALTETRSKAKPVNNDSNISFTPKTDNSPPSISTEDLVTTRNKLKHVDIPSTSTKVKEETLLPGQDSLKDTSFPDLPRPYEAKELP